MENNNSKDRDRRSFLSLFLNGKEESPSNAQKPEMVKMLTAEGKLVEVDKAVLDKIATKQKASNQEIYQWMKNPSKESNG